jgi:transcriptional regulator with XRE-family HTH domain
VNGVRIKSKASQLRREYSYRRGETVTQAEVAEAAGITESTLSRIENGRVTRYEAEVLAKLCAFYTSALERPIGVGDLLEYDANNKWVSDMVAV